MADLKYTAFRALDPFFNIVQRGLAGLVDGDFIFSVGGTPVRTPAEFHQAVRKFDGDVFLELADHRRITVQK